MMKEHILELDRPRTLRFGFKAVRLIRQKLGNRSIDSLMNMPVDEVPILAWAGLKWEDNSLTVEKVEDLLDEKIPGKYKLVDIIEIVMIAMAEQIGAEKGKKVEKKAPADELKQVTEKIPSKKSAKKR